MFIQGIRAPVLGAVFVGLLMLAGAFNASAQQAGQTIPNRFIITFHNDVPPGLAANDLANANGFRILHIYENTFSGMAIEVGSGRAAGILASLRNDSRVSSIGNDRYATVNAQAYPKGLNRVDGTGASAGVPNDGAGILVAVIDTGIDSDHADLAGRIDFAQSRSCLTEGGTSGCRQFDPGTTDLAYEDDHGHGTFVSGIIAADDNGIDIVGIVPQASIIAVKVCDSSGMCPDADIAAAFDYLAGLYSGGVPPDVVNVSLGGPCGGDCDTTTDPALVATHTAIDGLVGLGTTVVVAAGNESTDASTISPAAVDSVITASALVDFDGEPGGNGGSKIFLGAGRWSDDTFAKFSNYGDPVDVIAPGVTELSLNLGGGTTTMSGTSFSSPHAAGIAAVFVKDYMTKNGGARPSPALVKQALVETGECHEGAGSVFHNGVGCSEVWPGDRDNIAEPMARADNVVNFTPPVADDAAIASISVDSQPILDGVANNVSVQVSNVGTVTVGPLSVSLTDDGFAVASSPIGGITLAPGESSDLDFAWTPSGAGDHQLVAQHDLLDGNSANDSASLTATVQTPVHDAAILSVSAPASVGQGTQVDVAVDVKNEGTFDESFNVALDDGGSQIGSQAVNALTAGTTTTLHFSWDTTGAVLGDHTLTASHDLGTDEDATDNSASTISNVTEPVIGPSVDSISPNSMLATESPKNATILGSGFGTDPTAVSVTFANGAGPTPTATVNAVTDGSIDITVEVNLRGKKGSESWDVIVTTPNGSDTLAGGFMVTR